MNADLTAVVVVLTVALVVLAVGVVVVAAMVGPWSRRRAERVARTYRTRR